MRGARGAGLVVVGAWLTGVAGWGVGAALAQQAPPPFPDEWFFDGAQRPAPLKALEGKPAAALAIDSWIGNEVSIKGSAGKVVVVDFWATWCGPCMASIPHNVELVKKYGSQGLVFVGVHDSANGWSSAAQVVKDKGINYPVGVDKAGGPSVKDYAVQFWPTYVAIDRAGVVRAAGLLPTRVEEAVKALLAEKATDKVATAAAEFGPETYYGGASRPRRLREIEGTPAPRLSPAKWVDKELADGVMKNNVLVLTFVSPSLAVSLGELDKMTPIEKELSPQGVVFVGVCDGRGTWDTLVQYAKTKSLTMPLMLDSVEKKAAEDGKAASVSVTAAAFGVEHFPSIVVVDRAGRVRAAGVRADRVKLVVEKLLGEAAP